MKEDTKTNVSKFQNMANEKKRIICKGCGGEIAYFLSHLKKNSKCSKAYGEQKIARLEELKKKKEKGKRKEMGIRT